MIGAVVRAMFLTLLRDPGALVMSFIVPVAFFVIFAEIFANASAGELELRVSVRDELQSPESKRLLAALRADPTIREWLPGGSREAVLLAVRRGQADVGVVIRADGEPLGSAGGFGPAPILVYSDPSSSAAANLLVGRLQQAYASALPELLLGSVVGLIGSDFTEFDENQRAEIDAGLAAVRRDAERGAAPGWSLADLVETQAVAGRPSARNHVAYYAGAIAFMFLLLSASQGALTLFEERDSGVLDRIVAGPGGVAVAVNGKFVFLALQGIAQTALIFAVAWLVYRVNVAGAVGGWLAVALLSSATAAALALALVAACRSRAQAQTLASATILVMSAIGGSMVPRFFMPSWLQQVGWITPNTWVLEAYAGVLWRGSDSWELLPQIAMLCLASAVGLALAHIFARRLVRA